MNLRASVGPAGDGRFRHCPSRLLCASGPGPLAMDAVLTRRGDGSSSDASFPRKRQRQTAAICAKIAHLLEDNSGSFERVVRVHDYQGRDEVVLQLGLLHAAYFGFASLMFFRSEALCHRHVMSLVEMREFERPLVW